MPPLTLGLNSVITLCSINVGIALLLASTRIWIFRRRRLSSIAQLTEIGFCLALLCLLANTALLVVQFVEEKKARDSLGNEEAVVAAEFNKPIFIIRGFIGWILYILGLWALKLAYLGYYFELRKYLSKLSRLFYILACFYAVVGILVCYGVFLGVCWPVSRNWESVDKDPCTVSLSIPFNAVFSAANISSDILILFCGVHIIMNLRLNQRQRLGIIITTGVGVASIAMAVLRFVLFYNSITSQDDALAKLHLTEGTMILETFFAFAAFCLPPLRKLSFLQQCFTGGQSENNDSAMIETIGGSGGRKFLKSNHSELLSGNGDSTIELSRASSERYLARRV